MGEILTFDSFSCARCWTHSRSSDFTNINFRPERLYGICKSSLRFLIYDGLKWRNSAACCRSSTSGKPSVCCTVRPDSEIASNTALLINCFNCSSNKKPPVPVEGSNLISYYSSQYNFYRSLLSL